MEKLGRGGSLKEGLMHPDKSSLYPLAFGNTYGIAGGESVRHQQHDSKGHNAGPEQQPIWPLSSVASAADERGDGGRPSSRLSFVVHPIPDRSAHLGRLRSHGLPSDRHRVLINTFG